MLPTGAQAFDFNQQFGASRWVYNWGLEHKTKEYQATKKTLSWVDLANDLVKLKKQKDYLWLANANSQSLQMALRNLDNAFTSFFRKNNKFPKFKSKKNSKQSFQIPQTVKVDFKTEFVTIPKIGNVKIILHRKFKGNIKTCTISRSATNKYYISILVEDNKSFPSKKVFNKNKLIGIDLGLKSFITISDDRKIDNPKFLKRSEDRLKVLQRRFSKLKTNKLKTRLALLHEKVTNQRNDFLHKLTHQLTHENQVASIGVEDLSIKDMLQNSYLSKSISDASWNKFITFLDYKCDWYGRNLIKIGRFDASSKICNVCGNRNNNLTLADRTWQCSSCNINHDRDLNAALNIKNFAYLKFIRTPGTGDEFKQGFPEQLPSRAELRRKETLALRRG